MVGPMAGAQRVGVIGGSFNPIHLGHALLAITVKETKPVDEVVLVPVFKHPVKTDLMPFEDRVAMCELAVQANGIEVSRVEQETGESNAVMLRALRRKYPEGTQLLWVCGDDVFEWIDNVKGREMLCELDGLIVQRRLHQSDGGRSTDNFYKAPLDVSKVQALAAEYSVMIDFIYGELPHFSSTLVRNSPASWRAFLPQKVAAYIDERPGLLAQLVRTGDAPELPPITPTLSAACPDGTPHSLPKLPSLSSSCSNLSVDEQSFQSLLPEDPLPQHLPVLLGSLGPHIVAHILEKPQLVLDGCSPERGKTEELRLHSNAWREHAACFAQLASAPVCPNHLIQITDLSNNSNHNKL
ncbi:unnamed protein product [Polarella glacialis]|uniref:Cytidyltransferase-like domain-containing protein n=2 Tax=Polarella glacialis TaxID=89957 RepID=A0A813IKW5_POLGL|nr:unnamed protein product [Polarella glacialis]